MLVSVMKAVRSMVLILNGHSARRYSGLNLQFLLVCTGYFVE
jgi:hypothetical protein